MFTDKTYEIPYKINNGDVASIKITFEESKIAYHKGKPLCLLEFKNVLLGTVKELQGLKPDNIIVRTFDTKAGKEKRVPGFSSKKGNLSDKVNFLDKNGKSNNKNLFEILEQEGIYLHIIVPQKLLLNTQSKIQLQQKTLEEKSNEKQKGKELTSDKYKKLISNARDFIGAFIRMVNGINKEHMMGIIRLGVIHLRKHLKEYPDIVLDVLIDKLIKAVVEGKKPAKDKTFRQTIFGIEDNEENNRMTVTEFYLRQMIPEVKKAVFKTEGLTNNSNNNNTQNIEEIK